MSKITVKLLPYPTLLFSPLLEFQFESHLALCVCLVWVRRERVVGMTETGGGGGGGDLSASSKNRTTKHTLRLLQTAVCFHILLCAHYLSPNLTASQPCLSVLLTLACVHAQRGLLQSVCVCVCVCVSVCPSVCPPFFSVTTATPSVKRGHLLSSRRHARENKILERGRPEKLVKRTAAEVSVRQIEIADGRCTCTVLRC